VESYERVDGKRSMAREAVGGGFES